MKTVLLATLITASMLSVSVAQDNTTAVQEKPATFSSKPLVVSGRINADGSTLLSDIDAEWSVSNKEALKGYEGRLVRVKCFVDTEKNSIRILSVKGDESTRSYAVIHADSAFRR